MTHKDIREVKAYWNFNGEKREGNWGIQVKEFFFFFFFLIFGLPCGMQDLSSPTRDQTHAPLQWKHRVLTIGPPGKSQLKELLKRGIRDDDGKKGLCWAGGKKLKELKGQSTE